MPISQKIIKVCPKCNYTKVVYRGDCLPDSSMFQKCPICKNMMIDSDKNEDEIGGVLDVVFKFLRNIK